MNSASKPKILIVDDNKTNLFLLKALTENFAEVDLAENGKEAIKKFQDSFPKGKSYDLVLLDIMMPDIDGQEVLNYIKETERQNDVAPWDGAKVIMISALDDESNIFESHISGCDGYIVKPFSKNVFYEKLQEVGFNFSSVE